MHITKTYIVIISTLLTHLAGAFPTHSLTTGNSATIHARQDIGTGTVLPPNMTPNSFCSCQPDPDPLTISATLWIVEIPGQIMPSAQGTGDWGGGFLDNLRGQCGPISMWYATLDGAAAPNAGIIAEFVTTIFCSKKNVQDAAWLASDPDNRVVLGCDWSHQDAGEDRSDKTPKRQERTEHDYGRDRKTRRRLARPSETDLRSRD